MVYQIVGYNAWKLYKCELFLYYWSTNLLVDISHPSIKTISNIP